MKRIVVATDFSDASYGAVSYARQLARCFSAKVLLVHVIDAMRSSQLTGGHPAPLPDRIDAAEEELQRIGSSLAFDGIRCAVAVRVGDLRETMSDLIEERNADLLVIGTRGKGYKNGEGLGSVAAMLLRSVSCPVLTVGKYVRQDAYERTHERTVLFPTDFSETSRAALAYTECLTQHLAGRLLLLHVDSAAAAAQASSREKDFQGFTRGVTRPALISEYITRTGDPAETIVKVSAEKHADFIVMGVHGSGVAGKAHGEGFAFDVIRLAKCPVFTLSGEHEGKAVHHKVPAAAHA